MKIITLDQSHRIPAVVHAVAEATIKQIRNRQIKEYKPRKGDQGKLNLVGSYQPDTLPPHIVLCRDKFGIDAIEQELIDWGISYNIIGNRGKNLYSGPYARIMRAIAIGDADTLRKSGRYLSDYWKRNLEDGITPVHWSEAVDIGPEDAHYLTRMEALIMANEPPQVIISTIHRQKGREYDHVVLLTDESPMQDYQEKAATMDNEIRVWYTGITRCKESLTLIGQNRYIKYESNR